MPLLEITTNCTLAIAQQQSLVSEASTLVAALLGKPEQYVMVSINSSTTMCFAGDSQPLAYLTLKSIGLPGDQTKHYSQQLCEWLTQALDIPAQRIYIEFIDAPRHLWGWNGSTF